MGFLEDNLNNIKKQYFHENTSEWYCSGWKMMTGVGW